MPFPWGAAIQAGGQILGGLLGGKKEDTYHPEVWRNQRTHDYMRSIRDITLAAKEYGFHPLALLGSQSAGGFAQPVEGGSSNFGVGDSIGNAISAFGDLYQGEQDRQMAEQNAFQEREDAIQARVDADVARQNDPMYRAQLENMALQNDAIRMDMAESRTRIALARAAAIGGPQANVLQGPGGLTFNPPSIRSTAQQGEDQYGEAGDIIFGAGGLVDDLANDRVVVPGPVFPTPGQLLKKMGVDEPWFDLKGFLERMYRKNWGDRPGM